MIGIDYGTKRVGIAISDESNTLAFPYRVLPNNHLLVEEVVSIVDKEGIEGIVVGESKDFKGEENPVMANARAFVDQLERHTAAPVHFEPEYLTSFHAGHTSAPHLKDASAAAIILQTFLDKEKGKR